MVDVLSYQLAAFFGSVAAIMFGSGITYYKKWMELKEIAGIDVAFDRKFFMSAGIAFLFAIVAGILNFENAETQINPNDTIFKVFVSAFITGVAFNFGINAFMKPSTTLVSIIKQQQEQLKSQGKE